jgi:predicted AAA+ superfamily ATPase
MEEIAKNGTSPAYFYSAEEAITVGSDWLDTIWDNARTEIRLKKAKEGLLVIDEIQKINAWSECVKKNWDADTAAKFPLKLIILGSSRLLLQQGLSESLLGRFELLFMGHWSLPEMKAAFNFTPEQYVWFGGYPGAAALVSEEDRFKNYVVNSIIEPSLNRDIFMLEQINKPALLRQLFDLAVSYSAQILSYNKMLGQLADAGNTTTLARYTTLLDQAGLVAGLNQYSAKPLRVKLSSPKFLVHNTALFSAVQSETFEDGFIDSAKWGRHVESAVGAYLINQVNANPGAALYYWREKNTEVDFVLKWGKDLLALEVKSVPGKMNPENLVLFKKHFPAGKTLLVGESGLSYREFLTLPLGQIFKAL